MHRLAGRLLLRGVALSMVSESSTAHAGRFSEGEPALLLVIGVAPELFGWSGDDERELEHFVPAESTV